MWNSLTPQLSVADVGRCVLQAEQLRQHYMTKYDSEVADAFQALQPVLQNIKELKHKVSTLVYIRFYIVTYRAY